MKTREPAFPVVAGHEVYTTGASLREYAAIQVAAGFAANKKMVDALNETLVNEAIGLADALLAELEKTDG